MAITVKEAQTLYVSYFGRPADFVGLQYWTGTETLVGSLEQLAHSFYNSAEGKKYFPVDPATNQVDVTASINAIYANMFGRVPETAGFDYWYNEIASGKINPAEAAVAIYRGAQGKDALMIENKIAAATQFTDQVAASNQPSLYYGEQAFAKANEFLNTVTDVTDVTSAGFAAQVNAAVNVAEAAGGASSSEGGIFTLTTINPAGDISIASGILTNEANVGFEVPEGQSKYLTAGNDVVDLSKWNGSSGSVNISDTFSSDNDKVTVGASALQNNKLKLTSIENLEIVNAGVTDPVILNGANFKGLEAIKLIGDATTLNVSDFTQGIKVDATTNADSIIGSNKADTINGGAGNDTIVGNGGDDVLTGGNGADEFVVGTVKDAGVDQILDFSAEDKISMEGFVPNELKKFDASTFSTVTYKTLDSVLATFATGGANVTKNGDVVIFSYDGKTYALLANGAFTETGSALVDITGANVASLTESNFGAASPTPGGSDNNPTTTYANYTLFNDAVATGIPTQSAKITTMTAAQAATLATTDSGNLKYIAPEGIQAISGDNISINMTTAATTFDATAFDTKLLRGIEGTIQMNINGTAGADTITASKLGGTITAGSGADRITAGAGDDTFVIAADTGVTAAATKFASSSSIAAGDTIITGNNVNIINDFATGVDKIATTTKAAESALGKDATNGFTNGSGYYLNGTYENGTFTVAANGSGTDTLVFVAAGTDITTASNLQGAVVLVGAVATAADFIVAS